MTSLVRKFGLQSIIVAVVLLIVTLVYALLGNTNAYKEVNTWLYSPVSNIKTIHLLFAIWLIVLLTQSKK